MNWSRRELLQTLPGAAAWGTGRLLGGTSGLLLPTFASPSINAEEKRLPPVRTITRGPKHHWFAYYDKWQFDPTDRYVLGNEVAFEHRSPTPGDEIAVGVVDLEDGDRWTELGLSRAWNWQQGCMLQWLPGDRRVVVWNDCGDSGGFVTRLYDFDERKLLRTIPAPIYALAPDGKTAIAPDFRRLNDTRPGYGYCGEIDPHRDEFAPSQTGLWKIDLESGRSELLFSFAQIAKFGDINDEMRQSKHWFNHLLFSPDGTRFVFLHRWKTAEMGNRRKTRMLTANADGSDLHVLDASGVTSHFIWRDPRHILAWSNYQNRPGFFLFEDQTANAVQIAPQQMTADGHCTYLPGNEWILCDTYPDKDRQQHPYLVHVESQSKLPLGHFHSPPQYVGEWRCDTHPRFSRSGRFVVIDSPHTGEGRQMHLIDLRDIVGA
jgi:hypothetical protein